LGQAQTRPDQRRFRRAQIRHPGAPADRFRDLRTVDHAPQSALARYTQTQHIINRLNQPVNCITIGIRPRFQRHRANKRNTARLTPFDRYKKYLGSRGSPQFTAMMLVGCLRQRFSGGLDSIVPDLASDWSWEEDKARWPRRKPLTGLVRRKPM